MSGQKERKPFSQTRFYPVLFMIVVTAISIGILATFYHGSADRVQRYREYKHQTIVLGLFGIPDSTGGATLPADSVNVLYDRHVETMTKGDVTYYKVSQNGQLLGWAFPLHGSGLWGSISAMLAVSPDYKTILRLSIVDQNETPGLGARITESWFLRQFIGKSMVQGGTVSTFTLVPEDAAQLGGYEVRQITGATSSSRAVIQLLHNEYKRMAQQLGLGI